MFTFDGRTYEKNAYGYYEYYSYLREQLIKSDNPQSIIEEIKLKALYDAQSEVNEFYYWRMVDGEKLTSEQMEQFEESRRHLRYISEVTNHFCCIW